ncbi:DNA helicase [Heterostelium album PN500]|uniref:ATP-dependent DNA helicase n=1 Tax=Heterostelium pallidum (strain ATCC 26659 / Pp 5 / PN500) TaxID=670386 RepID=D3BA25_HETP5|nr:DNA helicase [Heterostelium album PN500]EFA81412.1 DNA helicase [Heterostelium album PN500]|eukprot:XP_020433530.1 DNA helicase [Heterostelium album PN500]
MSKFFKSNQRNSKQSSLNNNAVITDYFTITPKDNNNNNNSKNTNSYNNNNNNNNEKITISPLGSKLKRLHQLEEDDLLGDYNDNNKTSTTTSTSTTSTSTPITSLTINNQSNNKIIKIEEEEQQKQQQPLNKKLKSENININSNNININSNNSVNNNTGLKLIQPIKKQPISSTILPSKYGSTGFVSSSSLLASNNINNNSSNSLTTNNNVNMTGGIVSNSTSNLGVYQVQQPVIQQQQQQQQSIFKQINNYSSESLVHRSTSSPVSSSTINLSTSLNMNTNNLNNNSNNNNNNNNGYKTLQTIQQQKQQQQQQQQNNNISYIPFGSGPFKVDGMEPKKFKFKTKKDDIVISELLSKEQRNVVQLALDGNSIFFTGSAGTGKSFVLREIVNVLRVLHGDNVHVTASTGIAACNIGGTTLHSFAGIALGEKTALDYIRSIANNNKNLTRWRQTKVLIIDEVSMISCELLDKLDLIGQGLRKIPKPFGGIQVILVGDFCQLPPVNKNRDNNAASSFCFNAKCWKYLIDHSILLTKVYRQKDNHFVNILNQLRFGTIDEAGMTTLNKCVNNIIESEDGIIPTILYPHRNKVELENERKLKELKSDEMIFDAIDEGPDQYRDMLKNMQAQTRLTLKIGSQVILLKNLDFSSELVNGSRGVVVGFADIDDSGMEMPVVKFTTGITKTIHREVWKIEIGNVRVASRTQVPLALAWALSIHKSQGMSIDRLIIDLDGAFEAFHHHLYTCESLVSKPKLASCWDPTQLLQSPSMVLKIQSVFTFNDISSGECWYDVFENRMDGIDLCSTKTISFDVSS